MKRAAWALALLALPAQPAAARENRVVTCSTWRAREAESPGGPALVANVPSSMTPIDLDAVQMTDRKLTRRMVVEGLFAQRTPANTLLVTARFVNCTDKPLVVEARSSFMDASQVPTEPNSVWRRVYLPPRATGVYQERSLATTKVAAYLIELRGGE